MQRRQPPFQTFTQQPVIALSLKDVADYADGWLMDCEIRQHSRRTLDARRELLDKFLWFLRQNECAECGRPQIRAFLRYVETAHKEPEGRWGNLRMTQPVSAGTMQKYHSILRAFWNWTAAEMEMIGETLLSPMQNVGVTVDRPDQIRPFTLEQVEALLLACKKTSHPRRDEAIFLMLLDTGVRTTELCSLTMDRIEMKTRRIVVEGKGGKTRYLRFGSRTARALWQYLRERQRGPDEAVFLADGRYIGEPLTRFGIYRLFARLAAMTGITQARCSPHTLRHTFAILFLRNGGNQFTLMEMLGHTSLTMTKRYAAIAQADIDAQHAKYSPVDRLGKR